MSLAHNLPRPIPQEEEALVRVLKAGVCNTDLEITRGYNSFHGVLGHEFVGEVEECEDPAWLGQRVCAEINITCNNCSYCGAGIATHCSQRSVLGILNRDGAFADYISVPLRNLQPIPPQITDEEAVFVEPLAAAFQILRQVLVKASDRVVVLGDGKLGILCAQVLKLTGSSLLVVGKHPEKLQILEGMGIGVTEMRDHLQGEFDVAVEATGSESGLQSAIALTRPRGTIVLKSTVANNINVALAPAVVKELTIIGSRCGPFPDAIDALLHRRVAVRPIIHEQYSLSDGVLAMHRAAEPGILKVLLDMVN